MKYIMASILTLLLLAPGVVVAEEAQEPADVQPHVFEDLDGDGKSDRAAALESFNPGEEGDEIETSTLPYVEVEE